MHTDLLANSDSGLTPLSPSWVGAWWPGKDQNYGISLNKKKTKKNYGISRAVNKFCHFSLPDVVFHDSWQYLYLKRNKQFQVSPIHAFDCSE